MKARGVYVTFNYQVYSPSVPCQTGSGVFHLLKLDASIMTVTHGPPSFLPLPAEYVVVQMNPLEMVKSFATSHVIASFSKPWPLREYCAVVYKVRARLFQSCLISYLHCSTWSYSPCKSWHACDLLLLTRNTEPESRAKGVDSSSTAEDDSPFEECEFKRCLW